MLNIILNSNTFITGINLATPILLAALGGVVCNKTGNFNIALEGFMLIGAFSGLMGSYFFNSAAAGVFLAILITVFFALLYGLFCITFRANEIIVGFGFNMFAIAITGWLIEPIFGGKGSFYDPSISILNPIKLPIISQIPILNKLLSNYNIIVYISWILIFALYIMMYRTSLGYKLRALGENPGSLRANGLNIPKYSYLAQVIVGITCGLAGAFLSIGNLGMFTENMSAGRGVIAVTAVIFSNAYLPITALASLLFGFANSIAIQLQGLGFPTQFIEMIPYVLTILMLLPSAFKKKRLLKKKINSYK
ncbi:ABC transporter permease [Maledivibacter halophilus]|uniref:Simple sugar transport system permease protein n=1 Tax=Maledivibacter halophilus TaxID=36842 RepID=A0A1T5J6Z8_9FIRM|nr:ABC transporter permease [Maledivibacter halophilus]SKC47052.1 simple sugar transport system permease protein [Maledivibacter halophilus]